MKQTELDRLIQLAFRRLKAAGDVPYYLPEPERTIVLVASAQGIIGNGGFQYFFEMDFRGRPPYSVFSDAYRRLGATDAAEWLDQGAAMFPFKDPHRKVRRRREFMKAQPEKHPFHQLGDRLCDATDEIMGQLNRFIVRHEATLRKPLSKRGVQVGPRRAGKQMQRTRLAQAIEPRR